MIVKEQIDTGLTQDEAIAKMLKSIKKHHFKLVKKEKLTNGTVKIIIAPENSVSRETKGGDKMEAETKNGINIVDEIEKGLRGIKEKTIIEKEPVDLITSDYEWVCPQCETFNKTTEVRAIVKCYRCEKEFRVLAVHHT